MDTRNVMFKVTRKARKGPRSRINNRTGLRRLPADFCWTLLQALLGELSDQLSSNLRAELSDVFRRRQVAEYYSLDARYGAQSMANQVYPKLGNPAAVYMLTSIMRKCEDMALVDRKTRKETCLRGVRDVDSQIPSRDDICDHPVYSYARAWLRETLSHVPSRDAIQFSARHGPGSTASIPYGERSKFFKLATLPYRTGRSCRSQLFDCITADARWAGAVEDSLRRRDQIPAWSVIDRSRYEEVVIDGEHPYNIVTTVPKDGRKDRPIAKEQTGNIYLQLAVGHILRTRLRARGIDLDKQADVNRQMALDASLNHQMFTIDLSNASDTVGFDLVKQLLPPDWFLLLASLRAPWGVLPSGEAFLYRKFSSMGNGFTFELESLIFLAICKGIQRSYGHRSDRFVAFGDDIIGPDYLFLHTRNYLEFAGFRVNSEKSFHGKHPFRESCGVDALNGINIRPVFVKRIPRFVTEHIGVRNRIRSWFLRHLGSYPARLDSLFLNYLDYMPPIGPDSIETDGWLQDGPYAPGIKFQSLVLCSKNVASARELHLRKLMHNLRSCDGEGGNFLITDANEDR